MALDVYFPQDICRALLAAEQASNATWMATGGKEDDFARGYRQGYLAALTTIALAFGLLRPDGGHESEWQPACLAETALRHGKNGQSR
jgi:hypothetical protein